MSADPDADGFLARWSRRKAAARAVLPPPAAPAAPAVPVAASAPEPRQPAPASAPLPTDPAALEAERAAVLARLPRLETLGPDSDVRPFMHALVPPPLRSAALARIWVLDPAIRDFEGHARDYAWNWNVPGGVPGGGPAPGADEVAATLRQIFARFDRAETAAADAVDGGVAPVPAPAASPAASPPPRPSVAPPQSDPVAAARAVKAPLPVPAAPAAPAASASPDPAAPPRRHGGAMPV